MGSKTFGRIVTLSVALLVGLAIGLEIDSILRSAVSPAAGTRTAGPTAAEAVPTFAPAPARPSAGASPEPQRAETAAGAVAENPRRQPVVPSTPPPMSFRNVAEEVLPTVVEINTVEVVRQNIPRFRSPFDFFFGPGPQMEEREFERPGLGSGVILRHQGSSVYVLTNNHVVGDASEISVRLYDDREFEAELVGKDARTDLAMVRFSTREDVPVATLGDSDELHVGDWVLAVGNPFGFESTVTAGIVSAVGRRPQPGSPIAGFTDYIQTDASINPGNSGGALVNLSGEVVGINTWIASRSGGSVGLGFAIPSNTARRAIEDFITEGRIVYGWLGVSIEDADQARLPGVAEDLGIRGKEGALVVNVHSSSPAARGGIRPGDFIVSVDGDAVADARELMRLVGNLEPGKRTRFRVVRRGTERVFTVRLEERGNEEEIAGAESLWPGMVVIPLSPDIRERASIPSRIDGIVVASVLADSPADKAGLARGDVITMVDGADISDVAGFYSALNDTGSVVSLRVFREATLLGLRMQGL